MIERCESGSSLCITENPQEEENAKSGKFNSKGDWRNGLEIIVFFTGHYYDFKIAISSYTTSSMPALPRALNVAKVWRA